MVRLMAAWMHCQKDHGMVRLMADGWVRMLDIKEAVVKVALMVEEMENQKVHGMVRLMAA